MKTKNFFQNITKASAAFLFTASFAVTFTACSDDLTADNSQPVASPESAETLFEAYGLTYQVFDTPSDVIILNSDTTEISVSKNLADKLGITSFVNHPLGIWHQIDQLPYARKATAEKLVGDRYILTVQTATVAELIGNKEVMLNTGIYVNPNVQAGARTRAAGIDMPDYAAKYVDDNQVIHPAVIHMTDPLGYNGYHDPDDGEQPAKTRGIGAKGSYDFIIPGQNGATRASTHKRILSFNEEISVKKKFACGSKSNDSIDFDLKVPIDFELNYFITLNGDVKWKAILPVPYVKKCEAGLDGKFAFSPEMKIGFMKEWELDEDKFKKTLVKFPSYSFTFMVGCVPVVIDCQPSLYTKLDGKVSGEAVMGFKYEYENNFKGGVRYEDGDGWSVIKEFEEVKNSIKFIRPEAKVKAEAGIGIYFGMDVIIEGVAGPTVSVGPHVGAEAELTLSPLDKKWSEKANFKAGVTLDVNAEAGAKLKVLGYELAEFKTTFKLVGPWTLWKYPSDGTEHKVGDLDFSKEDYTNYNTMLSGFLKSNCSGSYTAYKTEMVELLCEIYDIDYNVANKIIQKMWMTKIIEQWRFIPTASTCYPEILELFAMCAGEVRIQYNDYLFQKAAEEGNTEYIVQKNWEHIIDLLSTNDEVRRWLKTYKGREQFVHQWFVEDFGREPSESPEDLEWLIDHMLNFNDYAYNR